MSNIFSSPASTVTNCRQAGDSQRSAWQTVTIDAEIGTPLYEPDFSKFDQEKYHLINTGPEGQHEFNLDLEILKILESEKRPKTVITIIGPARSGKSFLMNMFNGKSDLFKIGHEITSETKGFWFWKGDFPGDEERCLILFDVEGLFCSEKQDPEHDQKLFCLAVLSCSVLIVNNKTAISDEGLISLHRSIDFAQEFIVDNEKRFEDLSKHFPALVWAIRDVKIPRFVKQFKTADEYLRLTLDKENKQCETIKKFFKTRKCFAFSRPCDDEDDENLDQMDQSELRKPFLDEVNRLLTFIRENEKIKQFDTANGQCYADFFHHLWSSIKKKNLKLAHLNEYMSMGQNNEAFNAALTEFVANFQIEAFPVSKNNLQTLFDVKLKAAKIILHSEGLPQSESFSSFSETLQMKAEEIKNEKEKENSEASKAKCYEKLMELKMKWIGEKVGDRYEAPNGEGLLNLEKDIESLKIEFEELSEDEYGPSKLETYQQFERDEIQPAIDEVVSLERQNCVSWILTIKDGFASKTDISRLTNAAQRLFDGRKETIKQLVKISIDIKDIELDVKMKKFGANSASMLGNIAFTAGGIAILISGGLAAPIVIGIGVGSALTGVGSSLVKWYVNRQHEKKFAAHTAKLVDAIYKEKQLFSEFDFELKEITSTFDFQLQLKNGIRSYIGSGKSELKRILGKVLPPLELISIEDPAARKILSDLLQSVTNLLEAEQDNSARQKFDAFMNAARDLGNVSKVIAAAGPLFKEARSLGEVVVKNSISAMKEVGDDLVKVVTEKAIEKAFTEVFVGLGAVFIAIDLAQMIKDCTTKSLGESIDRLAKEICRLPPQTLEELLIDEEEEEILLALA